MNGAGGAAPRCRRAISRNRNGAARTSPAKRFCCTPSRASATPSSSCATRRWWRQKAQRVILEVPDSLMPLLDGFDGVTTVIAHGQPLPPFDLHCPLMSLPLAFGTTLATIPENGPYLRAPAERLEKWRTRLSALTGKRVGLVWSGKPAHKNDRNRSIRLSRLAPLLSVAGVNFVSLQQDYRDADRAELGELSAACAPRPGACRLRRHRGGGGRARSGDHGRYRGRASGRRHGQAGVDPALARAGLALAAGALRQPLVPERAALPAAGHRRLGQRDRKARTGLGRRCELAPRQTDRAIVNLPPD